MTFTERARIALGQAAATPTPAPASSGSSFSDRARAVLEASKKVREAERKPEQKKSYEELLLPTPGKSEERIREEAERRNYAAKMQQRAHESADLKTDEKTGGKGTYRQQLRALAYTGNGMTQAQREKAVEELQAAKAAENAVKQPYRDYREAFRGFAYTNNAMTAEEREREAERLAEGQRITLEEKQPEAP